MRGAATSDVVVVGAGAAGLMATIFAARAGRAVTLLESTGDGGRKILISGGGRCNVLPSALAPADYVTDSSPHSLRKMLLSWPLPEQRDFFERELGIALNLEEETGKLFPTSNRARDVRDALVRAAVGAGAVFRFGTRAADLNPAGEGWRVRAEGGSFDAGAVVLATGGLSVPKTGSDGAGLRWLAELGVRINRTYPALTPLTRTPPFHADLAGVSLQVSLFVPPPGGPLETRGGFLFTHRGYSGPTVLNVSHAAVRAGSPEQQKILVRWGTLQPEAWERLLSEGGSARVTSVLRRHLPDRLAERLISEATVDADRTLAQLRREERHALLAALTRYDLGWSGDEGYHKAEVTGGGVELAEVHPGTLELRRHPGLFVCGELLDAFGPIGGYNFAWAWATGRAAGIGAAAAARDSNPAGGEPDE
jgi:predicted Rossmann fold flavoprotein